MLMKKIDNQNRKTMKAELTDHNHGDTKKPSISDEKRDVQFISNRSRELDQKFQEYIDKKWSLSERLFNRSLYQGVVDIKSELLQISGDHRIKVYRTMTDAKLEAIREKFNAGIKMIKGHYRQQVSSFLMQKHEELSKEVQLRQVNFFEMMKEKYAYAETLTTYPSAKDRYMDSIYREEERHIQFLDNLLEGFESIVYEELNKY